MEIYLKLTSKDSKELMTCLNLFHEKLDYNTGVQSMNSDHLEELELVMNEFTESTLTAQYVEQVLKKEMKFWTDDNSQFQKIQAMGVLELP